MKKRVYIYLIGVLLSPLSSNACFSMEAIQEGPKKGTKGLEMGYYWSHKAHSIELSYNYHLSTSWHTKCGLAYRSNALIIGKNTYHWQLLDVKEAAFLQLFFGGAAVFNMKDNTLKTRKKKWNVGIPLGVTIEQYIGNCLVLFLSAETTFSFLTKDDFFRYNLGGGLCFRL